MNAPALRCEAVCAHPTGEVAPIHLKHRETRCGPTCGPLLTSRSLGPEFGKIYYAVISKGTSEASAQGSPEVRFTGTKEKAG